MVFMTKEGKLLEGSLVHQYPAFEGGMRYIIVVDGKQYRCVKDSNGDLVELIV